MNDKWMIYLGVEMCAIVAMFLVFGGKKEGTTVKPEPVAEVVEEEETSPSTEDPSAEQRRQQIQEQADIEARRQAAEEAAAEETYWAEIERKAAEYERKQAAKAAAKAAKEKAEREYWEDRKEWVENFPFEPTYHPELTYVPPQGEKWNVRDEDEEKMMFAVARHGFIRRFYENPLRYTRGFEMVVKIMEEYGYGNNPERISNVYNAVSGYYEKVAKATEDPDGRVPNNMAFNERGYSTWREKADRGYNVIVGNMRDHNRLLPGEELMPREIAVEIRERILTEIPEEEFTQYQGWFAYKHDYEKDLKRGEPLLMK